MKENQPAIIMDVPPTTTTTTTTAAIDSTEAVLEDKGGSLRPPTTTAAIDSTEAVLEDKGGALSVNNAGEKSKFESEVSEIKRVVNTISDKVELLSRGDFAVYLWRHEISKEIQAVKDDFTKLNTNVKESLVEFTAVIQDIRGTVTEAVEANKKQMAEFIECSKELIRITKENAENNKEKVNESDHQCEPLTARYTDPLNRECKNNDQVVVYTGNSQQSENKGIFKKLTSSSPSTTPPKVYYDVDEKEVHGLHAVILKNFPVAIKIDETTAFTKPCVLLTFIPMTDRIDMEKWRPICMSRMKASEGHHFIILVCSNVGDGALINPTNIRLEASTIFKTGSKMDNPRTGIRTGVHQATFIEKSAETAFSAIKLQINGKKK